MRSIAYWVLEDYSKALDTLLEQPCDNSSAEATFGERDAGKSYFFPDCFFFLFPSLEEKINSLRTVWFYVPLSLYVVTFKSYSLLNASK